ncbi:uncharacterized protein LOC116431412 [Nomia melanderi]|uniref:uncharacterized protein LOC116431412 n=1 Tax=Nomia melanderi TaxID=2448451 RepID=UPI003FCC3A45
MSRPTRATGGLTKTQQLREARTTALVRELQQKEEAAARHAADPFKPRKRITREPKRVDFHKPGMTKAMIARMKQAEKFKQDYERRTRGDQMPRRTPAPIGGDARLGKEKAIPTGRPQPLTVPPAKLGEAGPSGIPRRDGIPRPKSRLPEVSFSRKTNELAKMMNADVIKAEPVGKGPISNIVIPPGTVNDNRTTIITVPQPADAEAKSASQIANRSIVVISETLDDQDAAEAAAVQNKLEDLQQARRDFVMAVANVGGNAVNIADETPPGLMYRIPDLDSEALQPQYGRDHPDVVAAREFLRKTKEKMEEKMADKRLQEQFDRIAGEVLDDLHLDVPFEEELYVDRDISWEEDEELGTAIPVQSKVKSHAVPVPQQQQSYRHGTFDPEELERFFDVERYPPCPVCGPPSGRETLHPDLWDLEDPWYMPPVPDLIEFDLIDL